MEQNDSCHTANFHSRWKTWCGRQITGNGMKGQHSQKVTHIHRHVVLISWIKWLFLSMGYCLCRTFNNGLKLPLWNRLQGFTNGMFDILRWDHLRYGSRKAITATYRCISSVRQKKVESSHWVTEMAGRTLKPYAFIKRYSIPREEPLWSKAWWTPTCN